MHGDHRLMGIKQTILVRPSIEVTNGYRDKQQG